MISVDYYLKFPDINTAKSVLFQFVDSENNFILDSELHTLIVLGVNDRVQFINGDLNNPEIIPGDGFYVNLYLRDDSNQEIAAQLSEYILEEPVTPNNIRFGGNTPYSNETALIPFMNEEI